MAKLKLSYKKILEMRADDPKNFHEKMRCTTCPLWSKCVVISMKECKNYLNQFLDEFAKNKVG